MTDFNCKCENHDDVNYFIIRKLPQLAVETETNSSENPNHFSCFEKWRQPSPLISADSEEEEDEIVTLGFLKKLVDENKISVECHTPNCKHE